MSVRGLLAVCLCLAGSVFAATPRDAQEYFFDESLGDFHAELATAREQGKQGIFIFFEMDECPFCHRMRETVLNQPEIQDYYKAHFLNFTVDIEGDIEIADFHGNSVTEKDFAFREHRVRATPVLMFFDLDGKPVARHTGPTADAREFLWLGEYVVDGTYKTQSFTQYKRERRQAVH
jgi:thioredoxin-related protein